MSDNRQKQLHDRTQISRAEDDDVCYWTQTLGISAEDLNNLIAKLGNSADLVRQALRKRASYRGH